jgi:MutS domain V
MLTGAAPPRYAVSRMAIEHDPRIEYENRMGAWLERKQAEDQCYVRLGNLRLATAGAAAVMAWFAFGHQVISGWWLAAPLCLFIGLMIWHARVASAQKLAGRAIRFYTLGLKRLDDDWAGNGESGEVFAKPDHLYSSDLDLFGKGSVFELISTARTRSGEQVLASWLEAPAARDEVRARQQAVQELTRRIDLREDFALLGEAARSEIHPEIIEQWGKAPRAAFSKWLRWIVTGCAAIAVAVIAGFFGGIVPLSVVVASVAANVCLIAWMRKRTASVLAGCEMPAASLEVLSALLERLEKESFTSPLLQRLRSSLEVQGPATGRAAGLAASRRIAQLQRLMAWLDSSHHVLVRIIAPLLLWREHLALLIEKWREDNGEQVAEWLGACGEFEALCALAGLAYERPDWVFPELVSEDSQLEATALRHPLLGRRAVANDVSLNGGIRVWIVSGSNMSGKSTLLRAVGVNVVLACAGAPVAAASLRLPVLQVGASLRNVDSLQDGRSRFFAEITRIRNISEAAGNGGAVLFLLDELLSGTNSHDRRIGAAAIVKGLVDHGAIGMLTTHDLALAELEADLGHRAANLHFDDHMVDGRMEFDFKLRPGVVTHSNALELMRAVGLAV